jgi:hypothetical protein
MNVCFNGCSLTLGEGFDPDQRDSYIYDRLLEKKFNFSRTNIAVGGSSNYTIFMRSVDAVMSGHYDCVITQWSALNRMWLYPGPDAEFFVNDNELEFSYRHIRLGADEKRKFKNTLLLLNGDYHNIIDLVKFSNIIKAVAESTGTKVVFVNGLVPWEKDLITPLDKDLNSLLSDYSKQMLDFDHRADEEIAKFFQRLQEFAKQIDQTLWVNLFDSWQKNFVDVGPQGHHPGIKSHQWMADAIFKHCVNYQII